MRFGRTPSAEANSSVWKGQPFDCVDQESLKVQMTGLANSSEGRQK